MGRAGAGYWHREAGSETAAPQPLSWTVTGGLLKLWQQWRRGQLPP